MKSETMLDYAVFQLSPKRTRCELFVSRDGNTEKLASGLVKPFVSHLKVAEEQVGLGVQSIKLENERRRSSETWFTKGTLERFVRFVSTPEVLELVNTFDAEMSQLEAARRIYSQGTRDHLSSSSGGGGSAGTAAADATKKELLRAIDVRLVALRQDLTMSCTRASAAGFNPDSVSELQMFADRFGAHRLSEACSKFISVWERRPDLITQWKAGVDDGGVRASYGSDMSIEDQEQQPTSDTKQKPNLDQIQPKSSSIVEKEDSKKEDSGEVKQAGPPARRLSVQDRINLFETKQKEVVGSGGKTAVAKSAELKRQPSDASSTASTVAEKAVLRRWSGVSDMSVSIDLGTERKDSDTPLCTPTNADDKKGFHDTPASDSKAVSSEMSDGMSEFSTSSLSKSETVDSYSKTSSWPALNKADASSLKDQATPKVQYRIFSDGSVARLGSESETKLEDSANNYEAESVEKHVASETPTSGQSERDDDNRFFRESSKSYQPPQIEDMEEDEDLGLKARAVPTSRLRVPTKRTDASPYEGGSGSKPRESQSKGAERADLLSFQSGKKSPEEEDSVPQKTKFQRQPTPPQIKKPRSKREDNSSVSGNSKVDSEDQESFGSVSAPPVEQGRRTRQSKGNQELNDELTVKANELEKLFAEHKLRLPSDMSTTRRSKAPDITNEESLPQRKRAPDVTPPPPQLSEKINERPNHSEPLKKSLSHIGFSDDSRGKFYETYMQKRDAKLREEWGSKGPEKEAQMKAMQDSLERSKAEMMAKFSLSADRKDPVVGARWRAERLRSFNTRKADQQPSDYVDGDDDDDDDPSEGDGGYKSSLSKKVLPNRTLTSSTPRTASALPVPKSNSKASYTYGARRRMQSDNPLAQSVPNFSDLRKENSKPVSKIARPQLRNYPRSRSINEDKPRRSHALGKASAELKDTDSEPVVLTPIKFDIEQSVESKTFLGKNNGIGTAKLKSSLSNEEEFINELESFGLDESSNRIKEEEEDYEVVDCDDGSRLSQDSEKMVNSESENGDETSGQVSHQLQPGESPVSWISRKNDPFSYTNEASDIDASPMGSPASWNQTDADDAASRMRKKWGSAQKPMLVSNTQSRKDMTKGFKRLLKFGRKSRGTDSYVDWVSATTSEGDDDTEDGRDPAYRSSDDLLRKSRMGFSHSEDTFNDSEFYSEQAHSQRSSIPAPPANFKLREDHLSGSSMKAPRSFFSLSTFRSKGSDPKPR